MYNGHGPESEKIFRQHHLRIEHARNRDSGNVFNPNFQRRFWEKLWTLKTGLNERDVRLPDCPYEPDGIKLLLALGRTPVYFPPEIDTLDELDRLFPELEIIDDNWRVIDQIRDHPVANVSQHSGWTDVSLNARPLLKFRTPQEAKAGFINSDQENLSLGPYVAAYGFSSIVNDQPFDTESDGTWTCLFDYYDPNRHLYVFTSHRGTLRIAPENTIRPGLNTKVGYRNIGFPPDEV